MIYQKQRDFSNGQPLFLTQGNNDEYLITTDNFMSLGCSQCAVVSVVRCSLSSNGRLGRSVDKVGFASQKPSV